MTTRAKPKLRLGKRHHWKASNSIGGVVLCNLGFHCLLSSLLHMLRRIIAFLEAFSRYNEMSGYMKYTVYLH